MTLLQCTDLSVGYGAKPVSQQINFSLSKGDILCLVGENGAGKTTLLRTLLGLIPPLEGKMQFTGGLQQHQLGYLPQISQIQADFPALVREVVLSGCRLGRFQPFYTKAQKQTALEKLTLMQALHLQHHSFRTLSGGQQQRVLLARALCAADRLLFLDEPAGGLDPKMTEDLYQIIEQLNHTGMTILMISHDLSYALQKASHILHLTGKQQFYGTTAEYLASPVGQVYQSKEGFR